MPRQSVFDMKVSKVYPLLVAKAEKKGRTKAEVDEVTAWLTGYDSYSLPLNSLYMDLTKDEKIKNDSDDSISDVVALMKTIVCTSPAAVRPQLIESLMMTEPLCNYSEEIEAAKKKGDFND